MPSIAFTNYKYTHKKPKTNKQTNAHLANNLNPYATGSGLLALLWYALLYIKWPTTPLCKYYSKRCNSQWGQTLFVFHWPFTFHRLSLLTSSARSNWTGIFTSNSNSSWTDKQSSHFEMTLQCCWNPSEVVICKWWTNGLETWSGRLMSLGILTGEDENHPSKTSKQNYKPELLQCVLRWPTTPLWKRCR